MNTEERKMPAVGIGAVSGPAMVRSLARLGLLQAGASGEMERLAASGMPMKDIIQTPYSVDEIDMALAKTTATTTQRLQYKAALSQQALMRATR